jgi:hypothetical protein
MRGAVLPLPQYVFMAWCFVKHRDFTFTCAPRSSLVLALHCLQYADLTPVIATCLFGERKKKFVLPFVDVLCQSFTTFRKVNSYYGNMNISRHEEGLRFFTRTITLIHESRIYV